MRTLRDIFLIGYMLFSGAVAFKDGWEGYVNVWIVVTGFLVMFMYWMLSTRDALFDKFVLGDENVKKMRKEYWKYIFRS